MSIFNSDLTKLLKKIEKNSIDIFQLYLLVFFLINVQIDTALMPYALMLVLLNLIIVKLVSRFENYFFHQSNSKTDFLKYISISQGLVSFYFLYLLENYLSLDKELVNILEMGILVNAVIGLIYFEYGRLIFNEQFSDQHDDYQIDSEDELETKDEIEILPECKNLNKYLNDFKQY